MVANSFSQLLKGFSQSCRILLRKKRPAAKRERAHTPLGTRLGALSQALLGMQSEASGVAVAADLFDNYVRSSESDRLAFFRLLAERYTLDLERLRAACVAFLRSPSASHLNSLARGIESPRRELFRRLNVAPGATWRLVEMRGHLLGHLQVHPELSVVEDDLGALLKAWFNRGFLEMRRLISSSPGDLLERLIRYEAVHSIKDWEDLRSRLDPSDRRCFALFHPTMPHEPLIFVEIALTPEIPDNIQAILNPARELLDPAEARCAVFYSISNCQKGLQGVPFGDFLIKQVAADLSREMPQLRHFVTLSPVPGFLSYLREASAASTATDAADKLVAADLERFARPGWWEDAAGADRLRRLVLPHAMRYFLEAKLPNGKPLDPVARFHLGNGARLERINWLADRSDTGLRQSGGLMVNYLYDLTEVEPNQRAFADGVIATGKPMQQLAKTFAARRRRATEVDRTAPTAPTKPKARSDTRVSIN
jgi:malonyl-CoA decarboxylase